jgi:hypothetical protein
MAARAAPEPRDVQLGIPVEGPYKSDQYRY